MNVEQFKTEVRTAFAEYRRSEGCMCCQDKERHEEAENRLGKLLDIPRYADDSGYNFTQFTEKP